MGTNYIAPIWRMPRNANKDKLSNYSINFGGVSNYQSLDKILDLFYMSYFLIYILTNNENCGNTN